MEWMFILPLAGIVLGAIFLTFSIFLFIIKKGGAAGPMLMAGVLAAGLGSYYFMTGEEADSGTAASSEDEAKEEEDQQNEEMEEKDVSKEESVASEDTEEDSPPEETGKNEESSREDSDEEDEEQEDSESDNEQSNEEDEPTTGDAGGGAEEYEYSALYHLNDVFEELAYVAVSSESYYNNGDLDSEYYNSATSDIYSMDEAIEEARKLQNPPEGYGEFQLTYQEFLDEMQDYSDKLYDAIEEYEYGYDYNTLEEIITTSNTPVVDAVEVMNTESDEVFEHLDLRYETQNAEWEEDFYYD